MGAGLSPLLVIVLAQVASVVPNPSATASKDARAEDAQRDAALEAEVQEITERLNPEVRPAISQQLIDEDAKAYVRIRWRVKTWQYEKALKELDEADSRLFPDRLSLLRGEALEARRDYARAKAAYFDALHASGEAQVSEAAVRGLVSIAGKQGDYAAQVRYLEAMIGQVDQPDASLDLMRAQALIKIGKRDAARKQLWSILDIHPNPKTAESAEKLLFQVERRHRFTAAEKVRAELGRAHYYMRTAKWPKALQSLGQVKAWAPKMAAQIELEIADVHRMRGAKTLSEATLEHLLQNKKLGDLRAEVLLRLGRFASEHYRYPRARALFTELKEKFSGTSAAIAGAYEAAQLEYDANQFEAASEKMLAIAADEAHPELIPQALWMGGWAAYLSGTSTTAMIAFERLLQTDADQEMKEAAAYWLSRTYEQAFRGEEAVDGYRALAQHAPLRYYGLLARSRLEALGKPMPLEQPRGLEPPETVDRIVALLGKDRPINVDRAIALFRASFGREAVEELLTATDYYRRKDDKLGMAMAIDVFRIFERDAWASLVARNIAEETRLNPSAEPHFWRVWKMAYPTPFQDEVGRASKDHKVDPFLAYAVIRTESRFRPDAVSPVGARGLMQLMPATARWIGKMTSRARQYVPKFKAPGPNIWLGAWYVKNLVDRYRGNLVQALGAYNAGPGAMDRWLKRFGDLDMDAFAERTPYFETRHYIRRTLENFLIYHELYDPPGSPSPIFGKPAESALRAGT